VRVAVVGAGGIGGLYGGVLARAGHEVAFLARGAHLESIRRSGLEVRSSNFGHFTVAASASDDPKELGRAALVLFAVKTYDLDAAAEATRELLEPDSTVLTFQNGIDAPDRLAACIGKQHVLIGTTVLETTILEPGVIGHLSPFHSVTVSAFEGAPTPQVEHTAGILSAAGINTGVVQDGRRALWEKALFLSPMAAITAVCQSAIGPIRDEPSTQALLETLVREVALVGHACGYDVEDASREVLERARGLPPTVKASMARDFERGGRTELEALLGKLVQLAQSNGLEAPAFRTIYAVLKLRERALQPMGVSASGG
jgi:2-dehydropantoate 2-reductase